MSPSTMTTIMARTAAARMAVPRLAGQSSFFSTSRVLRNTLDSQAAATANTRRGLAGLFPRRIGWGGALVLFSLGVADGTVSTTWYLSRGKKE